MRWSRGSCRGVQVRRAEDCGAALGGHQPIPRVATLPPSRGLRLADSATEPHVTLSNLVVGKQRAPGYGEFRAAAVGAARKRPSGAFRRPNHVPSARLLIGGIELATTRSTNRASGEAFYDPARGGRCLAASGAIGREVSTASTANVPRETAPFGAEVLRRALRFPAWRRRDALHRPALAVGNRRAAGSGAGRPAETYAEA